MAVRCLAHNPYMVERRGRLNLAAPRAARDARPAYEFQERARGAGVCAGGSSCESREYDCVSRTLRQNLRDFRQIAGAPVGRRDAQRGGVERAAGGARSDRRGAAPQAAARRRDRGSPEDGRAVGARPRLRPPARRDGAAPARADRRPDRRVPQHPAGAARRDHPRRAAPRHRAIAVPAHAAARGRRDQRRSGAFARFSVA